MSNENRAIKRSGDYFKQAVNSSNKYSKSLNGIKTVKRKFKKRKHQLGRIKSGCLTDEASESSFDSSLIDTFNGLGTYSDSDDYVVLSKLRKSTSIQQDTTSASNKSCKKHLKRFLLNHSSASSTTKSHHKHRSRKSKSRFILVSSKLVNLQHAKRRRSGLEVCKHDKEIHDDDDDDRMSAAGQDSCSNETDNEQSSTLLSENEMTSHEADDEQSDWPVNEPSLIQSLNRIIHCSQDPSNVFNGKDMFDYLPSILPSNTREISQPYEKIIVNNFLSRSQRIAEETKDELAKILKRVENTLVQYDKAQNWKNDSNRVPIEFISEINDFEKILSDQVAKFKYKQQVTIFIVGHSNAIEEKNSLLEQLNEFFIEQQESFKEAELSNVELDFDLDNVAMDVEECLENAKKLGDHLSEINEEIIQYLISTASTKQTKGKKKLEKSLKETKEELTLLTDKLKHTQKDIEYKDGRIGDLVRQLELKTSEVNRYKNIAETQMRKEKQDKMLAEEIVKKDVEIKLLNERLVKFEREISELKLSKPFQSMKERSTSNSLISLAKKTSQASIVNEKHQKPNETNDTSTTSSNPNQLENDEQLERKDEIIRLKYEQEIKELKAFYEEKLFHEKEQQQQQQQSTLLIEEKQATTEVTQPETQAKLSSTKPKKPLKSKTPKSKTRPNVSRQKINQDSYKNADFVLLTNDREMTDFRSGTQKTREASKLTNLDDFEKLDDLEEELDLNSDEWITVNANELKKRYDILRRYAVHKIQYFKNENNKLGTYEVDKRNFMKRQFVEHKKLWETERSDLMDQAEQAFKLQIEAHNAAEQAIQQLEDFIKEDEKLNEMQVDLMRQCSRELSSMSASRQLSLSLPESEFKVKKSKTQIIIDTRSLLLRLPDKAALEVTFDTPIMVDHKKTPHAEKSSKSRVGKRKLEKSLINDNKLAIVDQKARSFVSSPSTCYPKSPSSSSTLNERSRETSFVIDAEREKSDLQSVKSKVIDTDETMMNEIRISIESRASLREKHVEQLQERKGHLEELKIKLSNQFAPRLHQDQLFKNQSKDDSPPSNSLNLLTDRPMSRAISSITTKTGISSRINSARHVIIEYLKIYDNVLNMKNSIVQTLQTSKKQNLILFADELKRQKSIELESNSIESNQIAKIKANIEEISLLIQSIFRKIVNELIASNYELQERIKNEEKLKLNSKKSDEMYTKKIRDLESLRENAKIKEEIVNQDQRFFELKMKYEQLLEKRVAESIIFDEIKKDNEAQVIELQRTIDQLKRQLQETIGKTKEREETNKEEVEPSIMFTRLDAERNAKRLKRAILKGSVSESEFKDAYKLMNDYISIPGQRLMALVKRFIHFKNIQAAKEIIQKNQNDGKKFVKSLENKPSTNQSDTLKKLQQERLKIAVDLMYSLDHIEQQSGIFLIKPMYSYKGKTIVEEFLAKHEHEKRQRYERQSKKAQSAKHFTPPTNHDDQRRSQTTVSRLSKPISEPTVPTWSVQDSLSIKSSERLPFIKSTSNISHLHLTTPKILEVDINRMMFSQNQVSSSIQPNDDANSNLRAYVAVNRPSGFIKKNVPLHAESKIETPFTPVNSTFEAPLDIRKNGTVSELAGRKSLKSEIEQIQEDDFEALSDIDKDSIF